MKLHTAISDWAETLALFAPQIQSALLELILPIAKIVQQSDQDNQQGHILPDGIEGVSNRGHYQDLLSSEWALLENFPEEFERRLVMQENLFLKKRNVESNSIKVTIVLFDSGPNQFGSPKLVQLALMLILFRRAKLNGALFHCASFQESNWINDNLTELSEKDIKYFTSLSSNSCVTSENLESWSQLIESQYGNATLDVWTVGGNEPLLLNRHHQTVAITTPSIVDQSFIDVTLNQRANRRAQLSLPKPALQIRILRSPFKKSSMPKMRHKVKSIGFSSTGNRIFSLGEEHLQVSFLPKTPNKSVKHSYEIANNSQVIAYCEYKNAYYSVIKKGSDYHLISKSHQARRQFGNNQYVKVKPSDKLISALYTGPNTTNHCVFILDANQKLRKASLKEGDKHIFETVDKNVAFLGKIDSTSCYITIKSNHLYCCTHLESRPALSKAFPLGTYTHPPIFVSNGGSWRRGRVGSLCYQKEQLLWRVVVNDQSTDYRLEDEYRVFGMFYHKNTRIIQSKPWLMCIHENQIVGFDGVDYHQVLTADAPIYAAIMSAAKDCFAYTLDNEHWNVYSLSHQAYLVKSLGAAQ